MLLGLAAGKIGDLVFYRDGGEQRTRTRVVPKNPRSPLQMAQRVKMANVSAVYRLFSNVMRDSFTNLPSNQSGYNAFAKQAIPVSPYVTRNMALRGAILPAPYAVSKGVLPRMFYSVTLLEEDVTFDANFAGLQAGMTTIAEVSSAILGNNEGFQNGDKIVFLGAGFIEVEEADGSVSYDVTNQVMVFTIDTTDTTTLAAAGFEVGENALRMPSPSSGDIAMFAAIQVREDASAGLMTSPAILELSPAAETIYNSYRTEQALNAAILSYGVGSESILRD